MSEQSINVALMVPPYATYTYTVPSVYTQLSGYTKECFLGARVCIPLGKRKAPVMGIITDIEARPLDASIEARPIEWILDVEALFSSHYLTMIKELALRYAIQEGIIYATVLPAPLRSLSSNIRFFGEKPHSYSLQELCRLPQEERNHHILLWWNKNYAFIQQDPREFDVYSLVKDPPWNIKANAKMQRALLHTLWEEGALTKEEIHIRSGVKNYAVIKQLIASGFIEVEKAQSTTEGKCVQYTKGGRDEIQVKGENSLAQEPLNGHSIQHLVIKKEIVKNATLPPCTSEQEEVCNALLEKLNKGNTVELLFGVTGSGKSRVYCELIYACLMKGKHVVLLAPEIALVQKLVHDINVFFEGVPYYVYHGYQSLLYKRSLFYAMRTLTQPSILIGTRSALFVPISHVGLYILDEEHDTSYKQENGTFLYNAKDVAWYLARSNDAMLLLGSATPDCKTLYSAMQGKITQHRLSVRATGVAMPTLEFIDMKKEKTLLSQRAVEALEDVIANKEQAILLLNRRGYAPHMYCTACASTQQCPHCHVSLLYHKAMNIVRCSYCGYKEHFPKPCSFCGAMQYITLGVGTEKLQEELDLLFPNQAPCIRLDRDSACSPRRVQALLDDFASGKSSFLLGTQMLAKGHNFPNVSLSLIVDADNGLHFPDYRAMERVYQLIVQTAGRAGRGKKQGHVIIQSYAIENPCWEFVRRNDYIGLYEYEMEIRKKRLYPPFTYIAILRIICTMQYEEVKQYIKEITLYVKENLQEPSCTILGPVPSPIAIMRGQYRYQMLIKAPSWQRIRSLSTALHNRFKKSKGIRLILDIDPISMM